MKSGKNYVIIIQIDWLLITSIPLKERIKTHITFLFTIYVIYVHCKTIFGKYRKIERRK